MKKILIVEDHAIVRMGVDFLINEMFQKVEVQQAANFNAALALIQENKFDLIILDINIPGGEHSRMISSIRAIQENAPILIFSDFDENIYAFHYLHAGANGYLSKGSSEDEYKVAISAVLNDGKYISKAVQSQMKNGIFDRTNVSSNPLAGFSQREVEILELLVEGKWTKEIAGILDLKETTISTYKTRIFEKLEVENIVEMFRKLELYKVEELK
jgi:DNA-binding NarL/FixJ family response regulator